MEKIWYTNPSMSEVIGRWAGMKNRMTTQNRQKSNAKKIKNKNLSTKRLHFRFYRTSKRSRI